MVNYFNSYKNFIDSHKIKDNMLIKIVNDKNIKLFEKHHIVPKCIAKSEEKDIVYLSEYDHCIAHILFNLSMIQKNKNPINYSFRNCFLNNPNDNVKYWKTIANIKVKVSRSNRNTEHIMTLNKALDYIASGRRDIKCKIKTRNKMLSKVLLNKFNKNDNINGYIIDFCF